MNKIKNVFNLQKQYFNTHETLSYSFRMDALNKLRISIIKHADNLLEALDKDLGKHQHEAYMTEIGIVLKEISYMEKHLKKLMKRKRVKSPLTDFPSISFIMPHPYGTVLIISPWNYPVNLSLAPLVGAIAAGNTAIIKPSEFSVNTSKAIEELIKDAYEDKYVCVIQGDKEVTQELLENKFNYIFFTGSTNVGKIIMEKASKFLTPVSLELGGKSPVIVDKTANIEVSAKRIAFGKFLNSGQTCIAPDYLLVHEDIKDRLVNGLKKSIEEFYGDKPIDSEHYSTIINEKHFNRLSAYLKNGEIIYGGDISVTKRKIGPTLITPIDNNLPIMTEEIFGPLLPIVTFNDMKEVVDFINNRPNPLALYLFTEDKKIESKVLTECQFGGGCINDTVVHIASDYLPFGGVGESGMGHYHGQSSFKTFTHYKSILKKATWFDLKIRYAPFTKTKSNIIKKFLK
ncbi:aldehyde dehydrogenase [Candidatus Izemoplasma sp. B36]|uniref:aldehyde dehydrogenase n=1 Tax=Candidatus Izemoplasma sp. B36 TaxID=3242468 RepID=UPI003558FDDD